MKRIIVIFLLCIVMVPGAIGQSKKFIRKLAWTAERPYKNKFMECNKDRLPESDFKVGIYEIKMTINTNMGWYEYDVFKDKLLVAHINVYDDELLKITGIKNVNSFNAAVAELKDHPNATIALTGESWYKEIAPYLKDVKKKEKEYVVIYEDITYVILMGECPTIYKSK